MPFVTSLFHYCKTIFFFYPTVCDDNVDNVDRKSTKRTRENYRDDDDVNFTNSGVVKKLKLTRDMGTSTESMSPNAKVTTVPASDAPTLTVSVSPEPVIANKITISETSSTTKTTKTTNTSNEIAIFPSDLTPIQPVSSLKGKGKQAVETVRKEEVHIKKNVVPDSYRPTPRRRILKPSRRIVRKLFDDISADLPVPIEKTTTTTTVSVPLIVEPTKRYSLAGPVLNLRYYRTNMYTNFQRK